MRSYFILVLIFITALYSCKSNKEPDFSLSKEEYKELGIPDYDKVWSFKDYSNSYFKLNEVKYEKPYS